MKIYIAGKITGDPDYKKKFALAEGELLRKGHMAISPARIPENPKWSWADYMAKSRELQNIADATLFLPDWKESKGAKEEHIHALACAQKTFYSIDDIPDITKVTK